MGAPARIGLVADDDAYFRMAAGAILSRQFGFSTIIEAGSFDEALERLGENSHIDIALFDLSMPGMRTPTNLRAVRECFPSAKVGVISASSNRRNILLALEAGVHGYMLKSLSITDLAAALQTIFNGGIYVPPCLADISSAVETSDEETSRFLVEKAEPSSAHVTEPMEASSPLTPRQRDVLDLLVKGKTNKEIALALGLGEGTVKIHMAAIFRYFGVNNRAAAAVAGARPYPNRSRNLMSST
ncbi:LuxR C-terminal-related transcriptional regulator [Microvirga guangxiensis]|uniref:Two component transcriptional regulator, LuxR family n=1 Tax=Microvirga guangxiensis TaxID=549386 RepID=A0A1G5IA52_9HYPH|nr:response regulator transcription factor [Microvirga guangxiensis]SCY72651.1 two component transcriptional regulator, LuxR family [Microvirga guangxiensis]